MINKRNFFITNIIVGIVLGIITSLIFTLGFVNPAIKASSNYNYKISESEKTIYDYRVYDPIDTQIDEMNAQSFIDTVFEYYTSSITISKGSQNYNTNAMYSKNVNSLNISSYNEDRIIKGKYDISVNKVFIDKIIADELDVNIGDTVFVDVKGNELELTVTAIFEDNTFYDNGSIFFMLNDELISNLGLSSTSYSAVLIDASNEILTYQYLETYIPLGAILPREYFSSNSEYDAYINNYMSDDHSSGIYVKNDVLNSLKNTYSEYLTNSRNMITIGSVLFVILMFTINLKLIFAFKYYKDYTKRTKTSIPTIEFRKNYMIVNTSSFIISLIFVLFILIRSMNQNIVYSNFLKTFLSPFIPIYIVAFLLINIVDQISISYINPKLKSKSQEEVLVYFKTLTVDELRYIAKEREIINIATMSKEEIIAELIKNTPVEDKKKRIK